MVVSREGCRITSPRAIHGFTLIELVVSIGIIGVLLAIALPAINSVQNVSVSFLCKSNLASIGTMYELYSNEHHGALPTNEFPLDPYGVPDPIVAPEWGVGGGGWLVLPISEIWFWGYQLRQYAADDPNAELFETIERLSCPIVYGQWQDNLPLNEREGAVRDPMYSPQRSYVHSAALFTRASSWSNPPFPPDVNAVHASVNIANVAYPSSKANLVEAAAHHDKRRTKLESAMNERFNILAMDGHVEQRRASESLEPVGFVGATTGAENPPVSYDQWAQTGLRFISTINGYLGHDW